MANLIENINQAISDFDSIKQAIENKKIEVGNISTAEYANKISQIQTDEEVMFSSDGRCYISDIIFPDSVTSIVNGAFQKCTNLKSVIIPNSVTSIGNLSFADCTNLKSVTISNSVTSISENAFQFTLNITSLKLENGFNASLTLSSWWGTTMLTAENMIAMFEALADLTGQTAKTLKIGKNNLNKLTDEEKAIATNKNWNLA